MSSQRVGHESFLPKTDWNVLEQVDTSVAITEKRSCARIEQMKSLEMDMSTSVEKKRALERRTENKMNRLACVHRDSTMRLRCSGARYTHKPEVAADALEKCMYMIDDSKKNFHALVRWVVNRWSYTEVSQGPSEELLAGGVCRPGSQFGCHVASKELGS